MCKHVADIDPALRLENAQIDPGTRGCAVYSACDTYRYVLGRTWDERLRTGIFVMLNPSTATAGGSDPTISRCMRRARNWGWGSLLVLNLFAFRSPYRRNLTDPDVEPFGPHNEAAWTAAIGGQRGGPIVCAWGKEAARPALRGRRQRFAALAQQEHWQLRCLGFVGRGQPAHPLPLSYDRQLVDLDLARIL